MGPCTPLKLVAVLFVDVPHSPTDVNVMITSKSGLRGNVLKLYDIYEIQDLHAVLGQIIQDDDLSMQEKLHTPIGKEPF